MFDADQKRRRLAAQELIGMLSKGHHGRHSLLLRTQFDQFTDQSQMAQMYTVKDADTDR